MTKEKSSNIVSSLELAQQEACKPGFCGMFRQQKLMKVEISEADLPWNRKQRKELQQPSEKNNLVKSLP